MIIEKVKFSYTMHDNQSDLFTPQHKRYRCVIRYNGKQYTTEYQCNPRYSKPTKESVLECIVSDASAYESARDVDDFLYEFGYTDSLKTVRNGEKVYKLCAKTAKALRRVFGDEYNALDEELNT